MKILLLSMPDCLPIFAITGTTTPSFALRSIIASVDIPDCEAGIIDFSFYRGKVRKILTAAVREFEPDVVAITALSFQFESAERIAGLVKQMAPRIITVLGGYHASLMAEEIGRTPAGLYFDFIVRGEGEITFRELIRALASDKRDFSGIAGLSFRNGKEFQHNSNRDLANLESLPLPSRHLDLLPHWSPIMGQIAPVETSRGCLMDCKFCSITKMYGKTFRRFPLERVMEDIGRARDRGANVIFLVDDNITLDPGRFQKLCEMIVKEKFNDLHYFAQVSSRGMARNPALVDSMKEANFRGIFMGVESLTLRNLERLGKGDILEDSKRAIQMLQSKGIRVMGGMIVGNPDDTEQDIVEAFSRMEDLGAYHVISQILTPYPKTQLREELLSAGLVVNPDDYSYYNGLGCNVSTMHMSAKKLQATVARENIKYFLRVIKRRRGYYAQRFWKNPAAVIFDIGMRFTLALPYILGREGRTKARI